MHHQMKPLKKNYHFLIGLQAPLLLPNGMCRTRGDLPPTNMHLVYGCTGLWHSWHLCQFLSMPSIPLHPAQQGVSWIDSVLSSVDIWQCLSARGGQGRVGSGRVGLGPC